MSELEPVRVQLSRTYALRLTVGQLGGFPSMQLAMEHVDPDGNVTVRGGFHVAMSRVPEVVEALQSLAVRAGW